MNGIQNLAALMEGASTPTRTGLMRGSITQRIPPSEEGAWKTLQLSANGLLIDKEDLEVTAGLELATGDSVLCWTPDAQRYLILCQVVPA